MNPIIEVQNLSKLYQIGAKEAYGSLRDEIMQAVTAPFRRFTTHKSQLTTDPNLWALKDISFEVNEGEVVGIIGRNGAGKSTLLKILSRITEPTSGRVVMRGRVASLLEVGTGFHPELTGRENIFLNGALLGMSSAEIRKKFDEIVAFSEIEKFLDTPVKRYSSGMYVRLAFAVAAHLEPEILIVDEVLAVGDAQFQKKCLGKMGEVAKGGRTVLFVSHNMAAVRNLCDRVVWLEEGRVKGISDTIEVTEKYLQQNLRVASLTDITAIINSLSDDPDLQIKGIDIRQRGELCNVILNGEPLDIEVRYNVLRRISGLRVYFDLCDDEGNILIRSFNDDDSDYMSVMEPGEYSSIAVIPANLLAPRSYELRVYGTIYNVRSIPPGGIGIPLFVESNNGINRAYPQDPIRAKLLPKIPWKTRQL